MKKNLNGIFENLVKFKPQTTKFNAVYISSIFFPTTTTLEASLKQTIQPNFSSDIQTVIRFLNLYTQILSLLLQSSSKFT